MIRPAIGIILIVLAAHPLYADELTIVTQPQGVTIQRPSTVPQSVTFAPPVVQTTFTPPGNAYDVCDQLVPYSINPNPAGLIYVLAGATWRQLIVPMGDSTVPLDLSGSVAIADFTPIQPVNIWLDVATTIEEWTALEVAYVAGDEFTPGQAFVPAQIITSWVDAPTHQGRAYPIDISLPDFTMPLPDNYQLSLPVVQTSGLNTSYKKWIINRRFLFNTTGVMQPIPIAASSIATPGLLDIKIPASETREMDGWSGILTMYMSDPITGALVGSAGFPLIFYPTVTRLP